MVGLECMNCIRTKKKDKTWYVAFKLDMSKAYDKVEWNYLRVVMIKLGFAERWVDLIMLCVTSVRYSVASTLMYVENFILGVV